MKKSTPQADWLTDLVFGHQAFLTLHSGPPEPISGPVDDCPSTKDRLAEFCDEPKWSASITAWAKDHPLNMEAYEE
jgi:hypothetical protein